MLRIEIRFARVLEVAMSYRDRLEAGRELAQRLLPYKDAANLIVLVLSRGGAPGGDEVARALRAPLDVFIVRTLAIPGCKQLTLGAIASGNTLVINPDTLRMFGVNKDALTQLLRK